MKMKYNPDIHHRKSIRIPEYDYGQPGYYFVTLNVQNRDCLFGEIKDSKIELTDIGKIIKYHWSKLPLYFKNIELDDYVIMPDHFHGIIRIVRAMHSNENIVFDKKHLENASPIQPTGTQPGSVAAIIQNFKSVTARKINHILKRSNHRLWQRNYWERVIRDEVELQKIRKYISENPLKWSEC